MKGSGAITAEVWGLLFDARTELTAYFQRVSRLPRETVEDCVLEGMIDTVTEYDPIIVASEANRIYVEPETILAARLKHFAQRRIGQAQRLTRKMTSDDTPIGEEDGDMRLRDLFVPRHNTAERIENYAEWMMFSRKGRCPLSAEEIMDLFGLRTPLAI